jgi:hypothetical protein
MKQCGIAMVLVLGLLLTACGGGNSSNVGTINGNWTATLTNNDTTPAFTFTTSLTQNSGAVVSGANLTFTFSSTDCFTSGGTQMGSFVLTGNMNGGVTGAFQLTIVSGTPAGNTLVLTGTLTGNTIAGQWVLSGGCAGQGTFTMTRM